MYAYIYIDICMYVQKEITFRGAQRGTFFENVIQLNSDAIHEAN